jgi:hypothetical protein
VRFSYRNGEGKPVYSVLYETREVVYPNPLNQWVNPSIHKKLTAFFSGFHSDRDLVESVLASLKDRYDVGANGVEDKIREHLLQQNFEFMFRPNLLKHLSQVYNLRAKTQEGESPAAGQRHYDVLWIFDIILTKENGGWKIDRFVFRGAQFKEVNLED